MKGNERKFKISLWLHMHQPDYYDQINEIQYLPWVRKQAVKGYYLVPSLIAKTQAKVNINFSGILLEQIRSYASGNIKDIYEALENKYADSLSASELEFVLNSFLIALPNKNERFEYLIEKKMHQQSFSIDEIRDIQVLFKLLFFAPLDEEIIELIKKGSNYSENDKETLIKVEKRIIQGLFESYKQLALKKQAELTITPYYHPILPLLIDISSAKRSKSNAVIPSINLSFRQDAVSNIKKSFELFKELFEFSPKGMWPAEGSISNEAIDLIKESGIEFIGSDELVLRKSNQNSQGIYNVRGLKTLFRDHAASDKIAFVYNKQNPSEAVSDLLARDNLVVILDGENPWDYYPNYGIDFLIELLTKLDSNNSILGSEIEANQTLDSIEPGSWVNGYFDTWIGDNESNRAWTYLYEAHNALSYNKNALEEIYKAESSDFFWWYSNFHKHEVNYDFDLLFRNHLIKAYSIANEKAPDYLRYPIKNKL
jgi:alpha-amylase/alpha-mannosidase (GH57 family)